MAALSSATAVEQLLGRVLRQPDASHRQAGALNQSYAFVVSRDFAQTAGALRDRLVAGAGFERREVGEFVTAARADQARMDLEGHAGRAVVRPVAIVQAAEVSRTTAIEFFHTPAELGERFRVPRLALRAHGELVLFDDVEVLEYPWDLSTYDAAPMRDEVTPLGAGLKVSEGGEINVGDESTRSFHVSGPTCNATWGWPIGPSTGTKCVLPPGCAATCPSSPSPSPTPASRPSWPSG